MSLNAIADAGSPEAREKQATESRKALVRELTSRVKDAATFWKPTFERISDDIRFAGGDQWQDAEEKMADAASDKFQVNFVQRELNQEVSAIYAKNPTVTCERRKRLEYTAWDGTEQSLMQAQALIQAVGPQLESVNQAQGVLQQEQQMPGMHDPAFLLQARQVADSLPAPVRAALAVVNDYQQGKQRKELFDKISETAEILFNDQLDAQQPDFESQMKDLILREKTTGTGFVSIKFQRQNESVITSSATRADLVNRLQRIQQMAEEQAEDDLTEAQKEQFRLEIAALQTAMQDQAGAVNTEGLVLDFKPTTSVIVDPKCRSLFKFLGAGWVAETFMLTPEQIEQQWGVDVKDMAVSYQHGVENKNQTNLNTKAGGAKDRDNTVSGNWPDRATACVWIIYDKDAQMQYTICDGYDDFLEEPQAPWPKVKGFWTLVALKLNRLEVEENNPKAGITIYGQSAVRLMKPMQEEVNRTQEALRQHRIANKPGYLCGKDTFDKNDREALSSRAAHDVIPLNNIPPGGDVTKVLAGVPTIPIDPQLYRTDGLMQQVMLTVGSQQANMGSQASNEKATGQAIAEQSRIAGVSSEVDSLDKFLCELARIGGEMLFGEMTAETVRTIVGPGAVWPNDPTNRESIKALLFLKVEAGSMGRPNRAMEISNLQNMMPQLVNLAQLKGLPLDPLVKYAAKVLEFDFDIDEWLAQAQPAMPGMMPAAPGAQPRPAQVPTDPAGAPPPNPGAMQSANVPGASLPHAMLKRAEA